MRRRAARNLQSPSNRVFIGLGSNLDNPVIQLRTASILIRRLIGPIVRSSSLYKSEPWGFTDQPWFLNQVIEIRTAKQPHRILRLLLHIELSMGRIRDLVNGPRRIDLDLLFCGNSVLSEKMLEIPHPRILSRNFVLIPLAEIAPDWVHPVTQMTMKQHLIASSDASTVLPAEHVE